MNIRRLLAVWSAKFIGFACRLTGKQGVTLAGQIALKLDPKILTELAGEVREKVFVVCGTNGKTTTNNLLCSAIEAEKKKVVCNHTGSNMLNGVVSAFVLSAGMNGHLDADYACIEIDEASTVRILPHFKPDYMVLTNLFRDQLDRYGEIDITMNLLKDAMHMAPDMTVIVNADDALSAYLAMESGNAYVTYGISEQVFEESSVNEIREGRFCKKCGEKLVYHFYHYSQLGDYECPSCGFKRPDPDFDASNIYAGGKLAFDVEGRHITASYRGFYNIYNILAAYTAARTAEMDLKHFNDVLYRFNPQNGRMEQFEIDGTHIMLNLAKNPAGFNQNISAVMEDETKKDVIILINDNDQDGIDISWLWDVDFDRFKDADVNSITVSGIRCQDMRLRLKYVDIPSALEPDVEKAIQERIKNGTGNLYVLVNYTALYSTRNILKKLEQG
ncbi:MurT ligase domain-containing protein [uncultured Robinsoniella sp.]|uniref:MurT ligase domain-containing protein n=1 Tax=uncultured Robinsoniella sp. TaxID=904190 RepID=UPI002909B090|nr:MurT ligase domain-containing protein [Clostridiales bacterium]